MTAWIRIKPGCWTFILLVAGWALISGCATMGKDECLTADWRTIGYEDGARGYPASRIGQHREACAKHGVTPDFDSYEHGRLEGLREYCTLHNGYGLGRAGKGYNYVCTEEMEPAFLKGYRQGKILYAAQVAVNRQQAELNRLYRDLDAVEQQLSDYEDELVKGRTGPKRRRHLLYEIKMLTDEQRALVAQVANQEDVVADAKTNLQAIQAQTPY